MAAQSGLTDVVRALIEKGARINATNNEGESALMKAAMKGHAEVVSVLLENKANADLRDQTVTLRFGS